MQIDDRQDETGSRARARIACGSAAENFPETEQRGRVPGVLSYGNYITAEIER